MGRPVPRVIDIHAWQTVAYDHESNRVVLGCRKCGNRREKGGSTNGMTMGSLLQIIDFLG